MDLIETYEDLIINVNELQKNIDLGDQNALELIKIGHSFLVSEHNGILQFSPSKFIGYKNNRLELYLGKRNDLDGRVTNSRIISLLERVDKKNDFIEKHFLHYCDRQGIVARDIRRKFWVLPDADSLINDMEISKIENSTIIETEKKELLKSRIGQGKFRSELLEVWKKCCLTGISFEPALNASHIKPWRDSNNTERLDVDNGLLLVANADSLFDRGFISFDENGNLIKSKKLSHGELLCLIGKNDFYLKLNARQKNYMEYHRNYVFIG